MERGSVIDAQITLQEEQEKLSLEDKANLYGNKGEYDMWRQLYNKMKFKGMQIRELRKPFIEVFNLH